MSMSIIRAWRRRRTVVVVVVVEIIVVLYAGIYRYNKQYIAAHKLGSNAGAHNTLAH